VKIGFASHRQSPFEKPGVHDGATRSSLAATRPATTHLASIGWATSHTRPTAPVACTLRAPVCGAHATEATFFFPSLARMQGEARDSEQLWNRRPRPVPRPCRKLPGRRTMTERPWGGHVWP